MVKIYMGVVVPSVILVPVIVALLTHRQWNTAEKYVFAYLILSAVFNIIAFVTSILLVNNLPFLHLYTALEFCLLCLLFRNFFENRDIRQLLIFLPCCFILFALAYVLAVNGFYKYNTLPRFLSSILIVGLCIYFLFEDLTRIESNQAMFNFTVVIGLMLYFSSSSILFGLSDAIRKNQILNYYIWNIHATIVAIMYLIFAWAFLRLKKE